MDNILPPNHCQQFVCPSLSDSLTKSRKSSAAVRRKTFHSGNRKRSCPGNMTLMSDSRIVDDAILTWERCLERDRICSYQDGRGLLAIPLRLQYTASTKQTPSLTLLEFRNNYFIFYFYLIGAQKNIPTLRKTQNNCFITPQNLYQPFPKNEI